MKRVGLELGGKNANIILSDADLVQAVARTSRGAFLNSGQFCMSVSRAYIHEDIYDEFTHKIVEAAKAFKVGDGFEEGVFNGPIISKVQMDRILGYIEAGNKEGAKLVLGGHQVDREGFFIEPTIFGDCSDDMTIASEEIFGPVLCLFKFKTVDEVIKRANASKYGLASGVFTKDINTALKVSESMKTGQVFVNCWSSVHPSTPFGGFKESGIGREMGGKSLDHYMEMSTIIINKV